MDENITINSNGKAVGFSAEKLALSNTITLEALIEVLARKGLIDKQEVLEEVKKIGKASGLRKD